MSVLYKWIWDQEEVGRVCVKKKCSVRESKDSVGMECSKVANESVQLSMCRKEHGE